MLKQRIDIDRHLRLFSRCNLTPVVIDADGRLSSLSGTHSSSFVAHPDDRAGLHLVLDDSADGAAIDLCLRLIMPDDGVRWHRLRATWDPDHSCWAGLIEDIDAERLGWEELRKSEERYRLAARAARDLVWELDPDNDGMILGDSVSDVLGYDIADGVVSGDWWRALIHDDDRSRVLSSWHEALTGERFHWVNEYRIRKADGRYAVILDRGYLLRDANGKVVRALGAMIDRTERLEADRHMQQMQGELIHGSRESAMETIASTIAHELNQPLTAITNYLCIGRHLIRRDAVAHSQEILGQIEAAIDSAQLAGEIIRHMRELFDRGRTRHSVIDLAKLVDEAMTLTLMGFCDLECARHIDIPEHARFVTADPIQIQQVLINLIRNAVEAMRESEEKQISIRSQAQGGQIEICVSDTGPGIAADEAARLFTPFCHSNSGGMGIGLAISRTIVEASGGEIWFVAGSDGGAAFHFSLPKADKRERRTRRGADA